MSIFQDTTTHYYTDTMTLRGYDFVAKIGICSERGNPLAIHGGRIISLELMCEDEWVAYYEDGTWYQWPDPDFEEGELAITLLIEKWRKYTPKKENNAIFVRGGLQ